MKNPGTAFAVATALLPIVGFIGGGFILGGVQGAKNAEKKMQREAVENNCGYYEADQKTGEVQFRWREFPPRTMIMKQGGVIEVPNE